MKRVLSFLLCLCMVLSLVPLTARAADGIAIDSTNFPDGNFRGYLQSQSYGFDGVLTNEEIADIKYLHISQRGIRDLTGIEWFTELAYLECHNNQLTALDTSKNTKLEGLKCDNNQLTSLDLSKNTMLYFLTCNDNVYSIWVDGERHFDLSTLPGNFDVSRASNWVGGMVSGNILTIDSAADKVTYTYQMSTSLNASFTLEVLGVDAQRVQIDESNFPDENFRNYLLEQDYGTDGVLTEEEISNITSLSISNMNVEDLTGIEYFTALKSLDCSFNGLTKLDVSENTALTALYCYDNQLTELDVSENTALTALYCYDNQLTELDTSKNAELNMLACSDNQLEKLDISKNTELHSLGCNNNQLESLDVSKNVNLVFVFCSDNQLTSLDVSKNTNLDYLDCDNNQLTKLDISKNSGLGHLNCRANQLTSLDISQNALLGFLDCGENKLEELDLSQIDDMAWLYCDYNQLTELDLTKHSDLRSLYCAGNRLTELDLTKHFNLKYLYCAGNQLTDLDISQNTNLRGLSCGANQLTELNLSKHTGLESLECDYNQLTELDISNNLKLESLYCSDNQLTELNVSEHTALLWLSCGDNQLTELDVSKNTALEWLFCSNNQLIELDVSKNTALTDLYCDSNQLTELDVSKNMALVWLGCDSNQLTSLDVSKNTALEYLECGGNQLTSLNLNNNVQLGGEYGGVDCEDNIYTISTNGTNRFDLTTLPGNFDVSKASNWVGGTVSGNILTINAHTITYTYKMNDQYSATFTLALEKDKCIDENHDYKCDLCGAYCPDRVSGTNRYVTATKVADQVKSAMGVEKFDTIIIASGAKFADALAGSYLASKKNAPILMSSNVADKRANIIAYINENLAPGGTVYILGGTAAVPAVYEKELSNFKVQRLSGKTRYETNQAILNAAGISAGEEILVCTGADFADSLSASATGKPILLVETTKSGKIKGVDSKFLSGLKNCTFTIVGGASAVSNEIAKQLSAYGKVTRISGKTRYETSVLVAERYFDDPEQMVLAYAKDYPDGLCGGILAYSLNAPLVLTKTGSESAATAYATENGITSAYVLGGEKLISNATVGKILGQN